MKLTITALLALTALVAASPAPELAERAVNCDECKNRYQYCVDNGVVRGVEKNAWTCAQHVCWKKPDCQGCGADFDKCSKNARLHQSCGEHDCAP